MLHDLAPVAVDEGEVEAEWDLFLLLLALSHVPNVVQGAKRRDLREREILLVPIVILEPINELNIDEIAALLRRRGKVGVGALHLDD